MNNEQSQPSDLTRHESQRSLLHVHLMLFRESIARLGLYRVMRYSWGYAFVGSMPIRPNLDSMNNASVQSTSICVRAAVRFVHSRFNICADAWTHLEVCRIEAMPIKTKFESNRYPTLFSSNFCTNFFMALKEYKVNVYNGLQNKLYKKFIANSLYPI